MPWATTACSASRVHSRRLESRTEFAARLAEELRKPVVATHDWQSCIEGADIVVEASRLERPAPMLKTAWIKPSALVVPYGTMSAVELSLTDVMDNQATVMDPLFKKIGQTTYTDADWAAVTAA